jgi:hypothetical protein
VMSVTQHLVAEDVLSLPVRYLVIWIQMVFLTLRIIVLTSAIPNSWILIMTLSETYVTLNQDVKDAELLSVRRSVD